MIINLSLDKTEIVGSTKFNYIHFYRLPELLAPLA